MRTNGAHGQLTHWPRLRIAVLSVLVVAGALAPLLTEAALAAPGPGPALSVDVNADRQPIDPRIYGMNTYLLDPALAAELDLPLERSGGNGSSEYNWQLGSTSYAADYYFEVFADDPGAGPADIVARDRGWGGRTMLSLPAMGWVAGTRGFEADPTLNACAYSVSKYAGLGTQTSFDPNPPAARQDCGSGWVCEPGSTVLAVDDEGHALDPDAHAGTFGYGGGFCVDDADGTRSAPVRITANDPTDASVCPGGQPDPDGDRFACNAPAAFAGQWVESLVAQHGRAADGGVAMYSLDNEPNLWATVHPHVHPDCSTYDEIFEKHRAVAVAAKSADPTAEIVGPATSGYPGSVDVEYRGAEGEACSIHSEPSPSKVARGGMDFAPWYLRQMRTYEREHGQRILDVFDQHYYPAQDGVTLEAAGSPTVQARRLESTRSLWDPTYLEDSWIQDVYPGLHMQLIRRMQSWVDLEYPGTDIAISEYNFGGEESVNGALAQADALGIFAREGLDAAMFWATNGNPALGTMPIANAFRMFRNYDGHGGRFGSTWVRSRSGDAGQSGQGRLAVYSALRDDGALTTMVINKTGDLLTSPLSVSGFAAGPQAQVWRYSDAHAAGIVRAADVVVGPTGSVTTSYPAGSITLLVTPPKPAAPVAAATTMTANALVLHLVAGVPLSALTPKATLVDAATGAGIPGQTLTFTAGPTTLCTAVTNASGTASCTLTLGGLIAGLLGSYGYTASYAGTSAHAPSSAQAKLIRIAGLFL